MLNCRNCNASFPNKGLLFRHKDYECTGSRYTTKVKCYDCHDMVYDLKEHRHSCSGKTMANTSIISVIGSYAASNSIVIKNRHPNRQSDQCRYCFGDRIRDIEAHYKICPNYELAMEQKLNNDAIVYGPGVCKYCYKEASNMKKHTQECHLFIKWTSPENKHTCRYCEYKTTKTTKYDIRQDMRDHRNTCELRAERTETYTRLCREYSSEVGVSLYTTEEKENNFVTFFALVDVSGSMEGTRLNTAKMLVMNYFLSTHQYDRFSMITFDSQPHMKLSPHSVSKLISNDEMFDNIDRLYASGFTALYDAIVLAINQIENKSVKSVIVCFTDGVDNRSVATLYDVQKMLSEYKNVSVSIIQIGDDVVEHKEICTSSNGVYIHANECNEDFINKSRNLIHKCTKKE